MQLVSLSISGFKSFARPTTLSFASGITAIVGPNGCGKSNVVDALRWVMGEQRTSVLRGDRMENVIFNGTVNRKATGMAEVKIVLNNENGFLSSPFTEVEIARRLYRDGTSEYLLNGHECRLKDVTDLLHDSGMGPNLYTILELKMVEEILREDGEGRRAMFEEAAGVAKYKIRRRQAQAKLKQTEEDLLRLADILTEVERHVGSLKRQAIRARKYAELSSQLKQLETANVWHSYQRLLSDLAPLELAVRDSSATSDSVKAALRLEEARLIEFRTAEIEADKEAGARRRDLAQVVQEISQIESESAGLRAREQACRDQIERSDREQILLDQKRELVTLRQQEQTTQAERQRSELGAADEVVAAADSEHAVVAEQLREVEAQARSHQEYVAALRRKLADAQRSYAQASAHHAALVSRNEMLRRDGMSILEQRTTLGVQLEQSESETAAAETTVEASAARVQEAEQARSTKQRELSELEEQVRTQSSLLDATSSKLDLLSTLAQQGPRSEARIRVLREQHIDGIVSLLGDAVQVDEPYRRAFQAVLGPAAYYHLAGSAEAALRAADVLRREQAGQGTFVSLAEFSHADDGDLHAPAGSLGTALALLKTGIESPVLRHYLGRVVLVESWDRVLELTDWARANRATVVALDGQWMSGTGVYHVGSEESRTPVDIGLAPQVIELNAELARQRTDLEALRVRLVNQRSELGSAEQAIGRARREYAEQEHRRATLRERRVKTETLLNSLSERQQSIDTQLRELDAEIVRAQQQETELTTAVQAAETDVSTGELSGGDVALRLATAQRSLTGARDRKHEAERRRDAARHQLELTRAELARIEQTLAEIAENLEQSAQSRSQAETDLVQIQSRLQEIEGQLLAKWKQRDHWTSMIDTAATRVDELRTRTSEQEERLRMLRQEHDTELEGERRVELEIARLRGEIDALVTSARSQQNLDLTAADFTETHPEVTTESTGDQVAELRERIERLGPVNLMAIEEFEAENSRLDLMLSQREDLLKAKKTIEETIQRINETAQAQFLHTFEAVRTHFQRLFQEFFPAGEADLILSGQDLLDADITLWANPSGKRLKSLSLMSGGEKTMTAIALLFALYQVKPSPFCVFDEVDAPLDDANIDRFNRVIRMHSQSTQFILITHNRRTMEIADNLYGVTMEEEGVSKLVSVRLLPTAVAS